MDANDKCGCYGEIPCLPEDTTLTYVAEGAANIIYKMNFQPLKEHHWQQSTVPKPGEPDEIPRPLHDISVSVFDEAPEGLGGSPFEGKLLRVRKQIGTSFNTMQTHKVYTTAFHPQFPPEQIIHQRLVAFNRIPNFIDQLNKVLKQAESDVESPPMGYPRRPEKRRGVYLADDQYGLLITDMTPKDGETTVEFKPKWLSPSPDAPAPPDSVRCRNCARKVMRAHEGLVNEDYTLANACANTWCPLLLLSVHISQIWLVCGAIIHDQKFYKEMIEENRAAQEDSDFKGDQPVTGDDPSALTAKQQDFVAKIRENLSLVLTDKRKGAGILRRLSNLQRNLDPHGILKSIKEPFIDTYEFKTLEIQKKLCMATTFRDCSIFFRFNEHTSEGEIRVGDLDFKHPSKVETWYDNEDELVTQGWYQGRPIMATFAEYVKDLATVRGRGAGACASQPVLVADSIPYDNMTYDATETGKLATKARNEKVGEIFAQFADLECDFLHCCHNPAYADLIDELHKTMLDGGTPIIPDSDTDSDAEYPSSPLIEFGSELETRLGFDREETWMFKEKITRKEKEVARAEKEKKFEIVSKKIEKEIEEKAKEKEKEEKEKEKEEKEEKEKEEKKKKKKKNGGGKARSKGRGHKSKK